MQEAVYDVSVKQLVKLDKAYVRLTESVITESVISD